MARVSLVEQLKRIGVAVLWLALYVVVGVGVTVVLNQIVPGIGGRAWWLARNGMYQLAGFLVATWLVGRLFNRYHWERMGWRPPRAFGWHFLRGVLVGAGLAAAAVLMAIATGAGVRVTGTAGFVGVAGPLAVGLLAAALSEELMFRGYPLRRLADAIGPALAIGVLAVGFAMAHLTNPSTGALGVVNIAIAAVWLAAAFFSAGGIALAWGLHFGWNAALSLVFDAPVSGLAFDVPGVDYTPGAHSWLDGGRFGPEGGVLGTLVLLAGLAIVLGRRAHMPRAWLTEATE